MGITEFGKDAMRTGRVCLSVCLLFAGCAASGNIGWDPLGSESATSQRTHESKTPPASQSEDPIDPVATERARQARIMRDVRDFLNRVEQAETQPGDHGATGHADPIYRDHGAAQHAVVRDPVDRRGVRQGDIPSSDFSTRPRVERPSGQAVASNAGLATDLSAVQIDEPLPAVPVVKSVSIVLPRLPWDEIDASRENQGDDPTMQANQPLARTVGMKADFDPDQFMERLSSRVVENGDVEQAWRLLLAGLTFERQADIPAESLPEETVDLMKQIRNLVSASRFLTMNPLQPGNEMLGEVQRLSEIVSGYADLEIPVVVLCSEVVMFGVYQELPSHVFEAGQSSEAILYIEVENLGSEKDADGLYRAELATRLELLKATGESVWKHEEKEIVDHCRRRRRDFFIAQRVRIPATLVAGEYVLKIVVEDMVSSKANEAVLPIEIGSQAPVVRQSSGN
ncbi:MAG: hypothetical protein ACPGXK_08935 [Phycisphaerae bacterium]